MRGGDRGGVPLGFFPWTGVSGVISLTQKEILWVYWVYDLVVADVLINNYDI